MLYTIIYFSGTGNTAHMAEKIKEKLLASKNNVQIFAIEKFKIEDIQNAIDNADKILFGYPIYGSDIPELMKTVMLKLDGKGKETGIFVTQYLFSGDGSGIAKRFLKNQNFKVNYGVHLNMKSNVNFKIIKEHKPLNKKEETKARLRLLKAESKMEVFTDAFVKGKSFKEGLGVLSIPLGLLQRPLFRLGYKFIKNKIKINQDKCNQCGYCINNCPHNNFEIKNEKYFAKDNCMLCLRCFNFCPENAITFCGIQPKDKNYKSLI